MKNIISILVFLFAIIFSGNAQTTKDAETFSLTINIAGLASNKGTLLVGLYNEKENFLNKTYKSAFGKIENKKSKIVIAGIPRGEYAVSFVHDENNNKKMDTNLFGIPKEDYGCSNNATGFMGPPKYDDAKFSLSSNKTIEISI